MNLCGIGYLEGRLGLIEAALAEGNAPGQALLDKLPRDKEKNLRPGSVPAFVAAIEAGADPEAALLLALAEDTATLLRAATHLWKLGNEAEDLRGSYRDAVNDLLEAVCEKEVHLVGPGRKRADNPSASLVPGKTIEAHIANIRFLVGNVWAARKWLGDCNLQVQAYKKAIGVFSNDLPGAAQEGRILVQRDRERMRQAGKGC